MNPITSITLLGPVVEPQPKSIASVISRVPSSLLTSRFMVSAMRPPGAVTSCGSSLPMHQRKTDGRLRSRRTMLSSSDRAVGSELIRLVSSSTSMPSRSQASSSDGDGGLCDVR